MGGISLPDFKLFNHSYSNQDCVGLVKEQTYRSMEQSREPRNGLTQIHPIDF